MSLLEEAVIVQTKEQSVLLEDIYWKLCVCVGGVCVRRGVCVCWVWGKEALRQCEVEVRLRRLWLRRRDLQPRLTYPVAAWQQKSSDHDGFWLLSPFRVVKKIWSQAPLLIYLIIFILFCFTSTRMQSGGKRRLELRHHKRRKKLCCSVFVHKSLPGLCASSLAGATVKTPSLFTGVRIELNKWLNFSWLWCDVQFYYYFIFAVASWSVLNCVSVQSGVWAAACIYSSHCLVT